MTSRLDVSTPPDRPRGGSGGDLTSAARALGVAALAALVMLVCYALLVRTHEGQRLDQTALDHVRSSDSPRLAVADLLQNLTVGALTLVLVCCVAVALVRRRWALAIAAVVIVAASMGSTEVLKHDVLSRPDLGLGQSNSFPSGHTTVVTSLVLAGLLVVPHGGRWAVGLAGSVGVAVTGVGTVVAGWHRPSDVVGGLAVTLATGSAVLAVLAVTHGTAPSRRPTPRPVALATGLAAAAALFIALGVRPDGTAADLLVHVVTMCGLSIAGAAVVGLFTWMVDTRFP
jgi:membrane-associated phospholipid phosphatase